MEKYNRNVYFSFIFSQSIKRKDTANELCRYKNIGQFTLTVQSHGKD